jgi:hypothetical protein
MATTSSSSAHAADHGRAQAHRSDTLMRRRLVSTLVMIGVAIAIGALLVAAYGRDAFFLYFAHLPVALLLLWMSANVVRFDERAAPGA